LSKDPGIWGRSARSRRVHFFIDGKAACGLSDHMDMDFPKGWDEDDPDTCKKCREWAHWIRKGGRKITHTA